MKFNIVCIKFDQKIKKNLKNLKPKLFRFFRFFSEPFSSPDQSAVKVNLANLHVTSSSRTELDIVTLVSNFYIG